MKNTRELRKTDHSYFQFPKDFMRCKSLVNKTTGESTKISHAQKMQYVYMRDQYVWRKSMSQEYFESQESIAEYLGYSVRSVRDGVKVLLAAGLLDIKIKVRSNVYTVMDIGVCELEVTSDVKSTDTSEVIVKKKEEQKTINEQVVMVSESKGEYDYPEHYFKSDNEVYVEDFIESIGG